MKKNNSKNIGITLGVIIILYLVNYLIPITLLTSYHEINYRTEYKEQKVYKNGEYIDIQESLYTSSLDLINSVNGWGKEYIIIPFIFKIIKGGGPYKDSLMILSKEEGSINYIDNTELSLEYQGKKISHVPHDSHMTTNEQVFILDFDFLLSGNVGNNIKYTILFDDNSDKYKIEGILNLDEKQYFGPFWFYIMSQQ